MRAKIAIDAIKQPKPEPSLSTKEDLLREQLTAYIKRVKSFKNDNNTINFAAGFDFFAASRAINREANYKLAKALLAELNQGIDVNTVFDQDYINETRKNIVIKLDRDDYVERGINGKMSEIINFAMKP